MLSKSKRLSTDSFKEIMEKGRMFHSPFFSLRMLPAQKDPRFSISVPKKVISTAVGRNKMRRRFYSTVKGFESLSLRPAGVVVIAKNGSEKLSFVDFSEEIKKIFVKSGILK